MFAGVASHTGVLLRMRWRTPRRSPELEATGLGDLEPHGQAHNGTVLNHVIFVARRAATLTEID